MNSRRTFILLAVLILGTTTLRLALGLHFYGFLTGDDVEILSAAFKNVYDLHYMPWNIRNLFISDFLVAPVLRLASAFRVTDTKTQLWIATFPFVCLSSINIFLTFVLANRWIKEKNAAIL